MRTALQQTAALKQELRMNPRLYQAMDLLYMPLLDLQQHLKQELELNPFLELAENETPDQEQATLEQEKAEAEERDDEVDWEDILLDGLSVGGRRQEYEAREQYEPIVVEARGLSDHLWDQLQMQQWGEREMFLAEEFIGNIGEDGYLQAGIDEILAGANQRRDEAIQAAPDAPAGAEAEHAGEDPLAAPFTPAEVDDLLAAIQRLDPPGVGARDLRECLMVQLREAGEADTLAYRLVTDAFDDLIQHRWTELAKRLGLEPRQVQDAADQLAKLDPKPGLRFSSTQQDYVLPDLVVEKIDGEYRVFLNDGGMPRLRISPIYRQIAGDKSKFVGENREFITEKLNSANWLIQAIEQRRQTMLRVMQFIVDRQRDFFDKGVEFLKPLTLREVAEVLGMHESTISRVTSQKYVQSPRGVFQLKYFFSSSLGTTTGEDASSRSVKAQIQKLVGDEDAAQPLTDAAIVTALRRRGIEIARRTVAKYRDQLGILPARMRKRV